jgi:hypothetical protein
MRFLLVKILINFTEIIASFDEKPQNARKRVTWLWLRSRILQMPSKLSIGMRLRARLGHSFRSRWTARSSRWV